MRGGSTLHFPKYWEISNSASIVSSAGNQVGVYKHSWDSWVLNPSNGAVQVSDNVYSMRLSTIVV
jgi:hypothetical protein